MLTEAVFDIMRELSGVATESLVAAAWQGALLAGAAALGLKLLPKTPAAVRFAIWFSVFLVVAALPFASGWARPTGGAGPDAGRAPWFTVSARWSESVLAVWLMLSFVRAVMLVVAAVRVRALWKRATPIEITAGEAAGEDVLGRRIQICASDEVDRPSVIGLFAPKVLIPGWLLERLTPHEMAQVVLHEAGHLRRADDWLNLLQKIALVIFPLNPALAWVERRLCFERELACDEQVLRATGAPKAYASCLAGLAEHRMTRRGIALIMGVLGRESDLAQRVQRILARGEQMRPAHARLVMGGAVCALLAGAAGLEHCPQLVGVSPGQSVTALSAIPGALGYRDVVYHPGMVGTDGLRAVPAVVRTPLPAQQSDAFSHVRSAEHAGWESPSVDQVNLSALQQVEARRVNAVRRKAVLRRFAQEQGPAGWVVMTSWRTNDDGYGARIVMTSTAAGPVQQPSPQAAVLVREEAGNVWAAAVSGQTLPAVQIEPQIQQGSSYRVVPVPYAAVPVRGGWLVIQL